MSTKKQEAAKQDQPGVDPYTNRYQSSSGSPEYDRLLEKARDLAPKPVKADDHTGNRHGQASFGAVAQRLEREAMNLRACGLNGAPAGDKHIALTCRACGAEKIVAVTASFTAEVLLCGSGRACNRAATVGAGI